MLQHFWSETVSPTQHIFLLFYEPRLENIYMKLFYNSNFSLMQTTVQIGEVLLQLITKSRPPCSGALLQKQKISLQLWYPSTKLYGVILQKTVILIFAPMRNSNRIKIKLSLAKKKSLPLSGIELQSSSPYPSHYADYISNSPRVQTRWGLASYGCCRCCTAFCFYYDGE